MSSDSPSPLSIEEYRALRATIRERGTARWIVIALTFVAWAWIVSTTQAPLSAPFPTPLSSLIPLVVLAAGFEIVFGLHVGVERVGRYLQARYEAADGSLPQWEHEAMAAGSVPELRSGIDPLAGWLFIAAAAVNLMRFGTPIMLIDVGLPGSTWLELAVSLALHSLFVVRLSRARRFAATQRDEDLRFFGRTRRGA